MAHRVKRERLRSRERGLFAIWGHFARTSRRRRGSDLFRGGRVQALVPTLRCSFVAVVFALAGCAPASTSAPPSSTVASTADSSAAASVPVPSTSAVDGLKNEDVNAIGQATMLPDGTLVLDLRRPAMAQKKYAPTDAEYRSVLDHVGPIQPGETKLVMPWPDDIDDARVARVVEDHVRATRAWSSDAWKHAIVGTNRDGQVVVRVTYAKDLTSQVNGGGESFQMLLDPKTYALVREVRFQ